MKTVRHFVPFYLLLKERKMFIFYNPNPSKKLVGDCVIRAISTVTDSDWADVYISIALQGLSMCDMPSSNAVWGAYLYSKGFRRYVIPNTCPDCYSVRDFCEDYPEGTYLLATGTHVIAVQDGNHYDTWNSEDETPIFYWRKEINR